MMTFTSKASYAFSFFSELLDAEGWTQRVIEVTGKTDL
jgi:hypothetical protein